MRQKRVEPDKLNEKKLPTQASVLGTDRGARSKPKPVLARSSFLASISASINAARFGSAQYAEWACRNVNYF
jgi:hypothetical protein